MDNNTNNNSSYEDVLQELKNRVESMKKKCFIEQKKLEKKIEEISLLDKDIGQMEIELTEHKSKTKKIQELWGEGEIEILRIKWMQEKASIVLEFNRRKNAVQSKTMDIIKHNYSNLTTCAFKTVRQETAIMMINNEINNLADRKKELGNKLHRLQNTKNENENYLAEARKELNELKTRDENLLRLRQKLQESETSRLNAIAKLNDLKISGFINKNDSHSLSHVSQKVEY